MYSGAPGRPVKATPEETRAEFRRAVADLNQALNEAPLPVRLAAVGLYTMPCLLWMVLDPQDFEEAMPVWYQRTAIQIGEAVLALCWWRRHGS